MDGNLFYYNVKESVILSAIREGHQSDYIDSM